MNERTYVLNLIITGIPSIRYDQKMHGKRICVLNLIITGIPSILKWQTNLDLKEMQCFKPYYNWNTFNTEDLYAITLSGMEVLNLIITGIPSIHKKENSWTDSFYVLNLIITGIPSIPLI